MASRYQRAVTDVPLEGWIRFGRALQDWREDVLGYKTRAEFVRKTGINIRMVQDLEKSPPSRAGSYTKFALQDAAEAYQIQPAAKLGEVAPSILAVLHGEADTFTRAEGGAGEMERAPAIAPPPVLPSAPPSGLLREDGARPYFLSVYDRVLAEADKGNSDPTGAQLGLPPEYADVWDATRGRMSRGDRAWTVAEVQRREAARREAADADSA